MDKKQVHDPLGRSVRRKDGEIVRCICLQSLQSLQNAEFLEGQRFSHFAGRAKDLFNIGFVIRKCIQKGAPPLPVTTISISCHSHNQSLYPLDIAESIVA